MHRVTPELSVDSVGVAAIFRVQQSLKRGEVGVGVVLLLAVILEGSTGDVVADPAQRPAGGLGEHLRSEEHTSELQSLMRISYAVFCLKKNNKQPITIYS